jgi:signal transduction histidine kinase
MKGGGRVDKDCISIVAETSGCHGVVIAHRLVTVPAGHRSNESASDLVAGAIVDHGGGAPSVRSCVTVAADQDDANGQLQEARAAQRRLLHAADLARQQVARDLHDGAQQRLVNLLIRLRLASQRIDSGERSVHELLDAAIDEAGAAINELRELASGACPSILTTRGLVASIRALAARSITPTTVTAALPVPLSGELERSAYFLVTEALANVAKHAQASIAWVTLTIDGHRLVVAVGDDGIGGANPDGGCGLVGMIDRTAALGGITRIRSPRDGGTLVVAEFPMRVTQAKVDRSSGCA